MATELSEKAQKALRLFEDGCLGHRSELEEKWRAQHRAYHGILEVASDASELTVLGERSERRRNLTPAA